MPNHIKNRITLHGSPERVYELTQKFGKMEDAKLALAHDGSVICINESGGVGWLNLNTGLFSRRGEKDVFGMPTEFKPSIKNSVFDFPCLNNIVQMPEILDGTTSPNRVNAKECKAATGHEDWHSWQVNNWGVKWGTYSHLQIAWNVYEFDTAWSAIPEMIERMHNDFKDIEIIYEWSDEDMGCNCGHAKFMHGQSYVYRLENNSKEAWELAFKLHPEDIDNFELVDGEYQYKED